MCFPFDAIVPDLPAGRVIAGGAAGERHTLTSADGTEFSTYLARAQGATGVVVLPDVRGLFGFYEQLAERFAAADHPAIALDYFGRTAGLGPRDADFEYMPHVRQTKPETVAQDVDAALAFLRSETGIERAITVGFCFGGAQSFMQAAFNPAGLAGVVGFYGSLVIEGQRWVLDRAGEMTLPVLGLFAGEDDHITREQISAFDDALERAARDRHLRGRPALVLRPQAGAVRRAIRRRLGAHPRLHLPIRGEGLSEDRLTVLGEASTELDANGVAWTLHVREVDSSPRAAFERCAARLAELASALGAVDVVRGAVTVEREYERQHERSPAATSPARPSSPRRLWSAPPTSRSRRWRRVPTRSKAPSSATRRVDRRAARRRGARRRGQRRGDGGGLGPQARARRQRHRPAGAAQGRSAPRRVARSGEGETTTDDSWWWRGLGWFVRRSRWCSNWSISGAVTASRASRGAPDPCPTVDLVPGGTRRGLPCPPRVVT